MNHSYFYNKHFEFILTQLNLYPNQIKKVTSYTRKSNLTKVNGLKNNFPISGES